MPYKIRQEGFTLLELLIVMGIIIALLAALVPAISSISKSSGRKAAVTNLLGAIEEGRAAAIKDGQSAYVVFPTFATSGPTTDPYNYKAYAVFEDDANNPGAVKQLSSWKKLPSGISLRANSASGSVTSLAKPSDLSSPVPTFTFSPIAGAAPTFYVVKFNPAGEVDYPPNSFLLGVFEGFVNNGTEVFTSSKDKNGNPLASEYLWVAQHTGRAVPTVTPTP